MPVAGSFVIVGVLRLICLFSSIEHMLFDDHQKTVANKVLNNL